MLGAVGKLFIHHSPCSLRAANVLASVHAGVLGAVEKLFIHHSPTNIGGMGQYSDTPIIQSTTLFQHGAKKKKKTWIWDMVCLQHLQVLEVPTKTRLESSMKGLTIWRPSQNTSQIQYK